MSHHVEVRLWVIGTVFMVTGAALLVATIWLMNQRTITYTSNRGERITIRWDGQPVNYRR